MPTESIVIAPELDERDLDRETQKVDDRLQEVGTDIPASFDMEGLEGDLEGLAPVGVGGGAGGVGAAGAGATGIDALRSRIPKPVAGVSVASALPVALAGGVGAGMLSAMQSASARLQTSASLLGIAADNFFREPGNVLDENVVRPIVNSTLTFSRSTDEAARELRETDGGIFPSNLQSLRERLGIGFEWLQGAPGPIGDLARFGGGAADFASDFEWPELPEFSFPDLPEFDFPDLPDFSFPDLPEFSWPGYPDFDFPDLPEFSWPELPEFSWPSIPKPGWWGNPFDETTGESDPPPGPTDETQERIDQTGGNFPDAITGPLEEVRERFAENTADLETGPPGPTDEYWERFGNQRGSVISRPTPMVAGEAGPEVIAPYAEFRRTIEGVAQQASDSGGGGEVDMTSVERKLDELNRTLRSLKSMFDVTVEVDGEQIARASKDGERNRIADRNPTV